MISLDYYIEGSKIVNEEIAQRAEESIKGDFTKHYVAYHYEDDVAFVSLDINEKHEYLILYELLVPLVKRHRGYGAMVLSEIEQYAKNLGFKKVILNPIPFKCDYPKERLIKWYLLNGYKVINSTGEMEKNIQS